MIIFEGETYSQLRQRMMDAVSHAQHGEIVRGDAFDNPRVRAALENCMPISEVQARGNDWIWRKDEGHPGKWGRKPCPVGAILPSHALYMPYTTSSDLFFVSARTVDCSGLNAFVIDSSFDGIDAELVPSSWGIYRPSNRLTFTQVQNAAQRIARQLNVDVLLFAHSDIRCHDPFVVRDLISDLLAAPANGVEFSTYDSLCAMRMTAVNCVGPWDESFNWYSSDCDFYHRVRLAGWRADASAQQYLSRVHHIVNGSQRDPEWKAIAKSEEGHLVHKWGANYENATPYNL